MVLLDEVYLTKWVHPVSSALDVKRSQYPKKLSISLAQGRQLEGGHSTNRQ